MLVDDERLMLDRLSRSEAWRKADMRIMTLAHNGCEALDYLKRHGVDLVFTDMKMPLMGGVELIAAARGICGTRFVALSAYDDFALVREAFRLGAIDYLLKSDILNERVFLRALLQIRTKYKPDTAICEDHATVKRAVDAMPADESDKLLIVTCRADAASCEQIAREVHGRVSYARIKVVALPYVCALLCAVPRSNQTTAQLDIQVSTSTALRELGVSSSAGISRVGALSDAPALLDDAMSALGQSYYARLGECVRLSAVSASIYRTDGDVFEQLRRANDSLMFEQARSLALKALDRYAAHLPAKSSTIAFAMELLYSATRYFNALELTPPYALNERLHEELAETRVYAELRALIERHLTALYTRYDPLANVISAVQVYIERNFKDDIALGDVARLFGMSDSTLSRMFTRETGVHFTAYINTIRLNNAMTLLRQPNLTISDIAQRSGFINVEYFSRLFKKQLGITPTQYRETNSY